ncbi:glycosyltransferase family 2 protein, partial [bacterium]|nr:glycosyltransferase family 2 protein [bacterium]
CQKSVGKKRKSSIKILKAIIACLSGGFTFRPVMFFMLPGFALMLLSAYPLGWAFTHTMTYYYKVPSSVGFIGSRLSGAIASAFSLSPHSFLIGGITLILSIQLISLGVLALQSKRYFEDLFHLCTTIHRYYQENQR